MSVFDLRAVTVVLSYHTCSSQVWEFASESTNKILLFLVGGAGGKASEGTNSKAKPFPHLPGLVWGAGNGRAHPLRLGACAPAARNSPGHTPRPHCPLSAHTPARPGPSPGDTRPNTDETDSGPRPADDSLNLRILPNFHTWSESPLTLLRVQAAPHPRDRPASQEVQ